MHQRPVFIVGCRSSRASGESGPDSSSGVGEIAAAVADVGLACERFPDVSSLRAALDEREPLCVFVPAGGAMLSEVCLALRSHARFARVPAFGVTGGTFGPIGARVPTPSDLTFIDLFQSGGDDLVPAMRTSVLRRLRPLLARPEATGPGRPQGTAIVAGTDRSWRSILGRTLFNGGLSVRFVDEPGRALVEAESEGVRLVVVADEEGFDAVDAVRHARGQGQTVPWIVVAPPRKLTATAAALAGFEGAAATDAFAPPENVLFLANELSRPRGVDNRKSVRHLFGTRVSFRVAGREEDEVGFTYNISEGGLYVRTAAPVEPGEEVWLEMWPPRSERRVRLAGKVAWRRHLGPNDFATVPAGFGVQLSAGLAGDLERWQAGYRAFAAQAFGARPSMLPEEK